MKHIFFALFCFILVISSVTQSLALSPDKIVYQRALQSGDAAVMEAAETLKKAGILRPILQKQTKPVKKPDCQIVLHENILKSTLARDMMNNEMPKELKSIDVAFLKDGIALSGQVDGPLFINPRFKTLVTLRSVKYNTVDVIMRHVTVAGIKLKFLNNLIFNFIERKLAGPFSQYITLENLGKQNDGSVVMRITIKPDGFTPLLGGKGAVSRIFTTPEEMHLHVVLF
jgi:hypothetical protein